MAPSIPRLGPSAGGNVLASRGLLYAYGTFTSIGGSPFNHIAAWDGSAWDAVGTGQTDTVSFLMETNAGLLAASQTAVAGSTVTSFSQWNGSAWSPAPYTALTGTVGAMTVYNGDLIVAGTFTIGGQTVSLVRWDGSAWQLPAGVGNVLIFGLSVHDGELIVGGGFTSMNGVTAHNIAAWNGSSWRSFGCRASTTWSCPWPTSAAHCTSVEPSP